MATTPCRRRSATERLLGTTSSSVNTCFALRLDVTYRSMTVVGQDELDTKSVNLRNRDDAGTKARGEVLPLEEVITKLAALKSSKRLENVLQ